MAWILIALMLAVVASGCGGKRNYPHEGGLVGQLEKEVVALKITNRTLREELQSCADGTLPGTTFTTLSQLFRGSEVEVVREGSHVVLRVRTAFLYADPYALRGRDEARPALDLIATALRVNPDPHVEIHGHTDSGLLPPAVARRYRTQTELSYHQAAAVAERLVREFGVDATRLAVVAHGGNVPLATDDTPEGQALNRRVEIHLVPPALE